MNNVYNGGVLIEITTHIIYISEILLQLFEGDEGWGVIPATCILGKCPMILESDHNAYQLLFSKVFPERSI